jgi:hypothetical protein
MYAAHFAAGLAIRSRVKKAPLWPLLAGAFVPDFVWIVLAWRGVEPTEPARFFDDWSHSLIMVMVWATLFAVLFYRCYGIRVFWAVWLAVFSHFLLDLPIHPKDLALYPHSTVHLGWGLWRIGPLYYWFAQLGVLLALLGVYVQGSLRQRLARDRIAMSCYLVVALHLLMFPGV